MDNVDASPEKIDFFVYNIMEWGKKNKRHFVWRERNDEFFVVFISEFFLRKTKSETVDSFLRNVTFILKNNHQGDEIMFRMWFT